MEGLLLRREVLSRRKARLRWEILSCLEHCVNRKAKTSVTRFVMFVSLHYHLFTQ